MVPFAAYLRTSTDDHQSPADSAAWQLRLSRQLIESADGEIVVTFHGRRSVPIDPVGAPARSSPPPRRACDPSRSWTDLVSAEPQRAVAGNLFGLVLVYPVLVHFGVSL